MLKHASSPFLSELPVQSARKRLLLSFAALQGGVGDGLSGTGAAQVGFGRGCRALHPPIPKLLNIARERRRAWLLRLRRAGLRDHRRSWRIGPRRRACEKGENKRNSQGLHVPIEPGPFRTVKLISRRAFFRSGTALSARDNPVPAQTGVQSRAATSSSIQN